MSRRSEPRRVAVVRYLDPEGHQVPKGTPGARRVKTLSDTYYAFLGGKRVPLGTPDLEEAWARLKEIRERGTAGVSRLPLAELLDAWALSLPEPKQAPGGRRRVDLRLFRVRRLVELAGWRKAADVTSGSAAAALKKLTRTSTAKNPKPPRPVAPHTRNLYLGALRQFVRWLCGPPCNLGAYPLAGLKPIPIEHDVRRKRRTPTDGEVIRLFTYLETAPAWRGMTGPQRALGYKVLMACGLRVQELRSLTPDSFDLDGATVTVHAGYDKSSRLIEQPLPFWLVEELRPHFAAGGGCWSGFPYYAAVRVWRRDLLGAGIEYQTTDRDGKTPLYLDLHSLRHWYVTEIASQPGIDLKTGMTLTRHSTPALFLKVYAKVKQDRLRAAAEAIPRPGGPS